MQTNKKNLSIILIIGFLVLFIFIIFIGLVNYSNDSSIKKDPYGDLVETKISGEPNIGDQKSFIFIRDEYTRNNLSTTQMLPIEKSIKYFIWDNINENENKAVMKNGELNLLNNKNVYKSEVRTNQNKTGFYILIYLSNKNDIERAEIIYENKTFPI